MTPDRGDHARRRWSASSTGGTVAVKATPGWEVGPDANCAARNFFAACLHGLDDAPRGSAWPPAQVVTVVRRSGHRGPSPVSAATGGSTAGPVTRAVLDKALGVPG